MKTFWVDVSRHNGEIDALKLKQRGFHGVIARCVVGQAERDPLYLMHKQRAEDEGLMFGAYGVTWPANRDPEGDAENFIDRLIPGLAPRRPVFIVGDHELGLHAHSAGHHLLSGEELVEYAIRYNQRLIEYSDYDDAGFYSARWYWNSSKLAPFIDRGEREFWPFPAHYPYDPRQIPLLPPRYSADVLDPDDRGNVQVMVMAPWTADEVKARGAWQWTSKGRGKVDGYQVSTFMDRDVFYFDVEPGPPEPPPPSGPKIPIEVHVPSGVVVGEVEVEIRKG